MSAAAGWVRAAEAMLRTGGREVVVRQCVGGGVAPPMEVVLRPCLLRVMSESAELIVSAEAVRRAAGPVGTPETLFDVTMRVVTEDVVWRVASYAAVECSGAAVMWRVVLAR